MFESGDNGRSYIPEFRIYFWRNTQLTRVDLLSSATIGGPEKVSKTPVTNQKIKLNR